MKTRKTALLPLPFKTAAMAFAAASASLFITPASAATLSLHDWYAVNSNVNALVADGDTSSPTYQNVAAQGINRIYSYFDPTTLADGQSLTLSFTLTFHLPEPATTKTFSDIRFGLFHSSTPHATTAPTSFGEDRVSSASTTTNAWSGFLVRDPGSASGPLRLYRKTGGAADSFAVTGDSNLTSNLTTTGGYSFIFQDGVARTFTLTLQRTGADLGISGSYGTGTFEETVVGAFSGGAYDLFDAFGFYSVSSDGVLIDSLQLTNVTLQVIPEPFSVTFLLLTGGPLILAGTGSRSRLKKSLR
ncbi:MAG TPA: hypothetical protein VNQ90_19460 [Chthoniobacteraceae bacterium]|nr:hypothetical protein [Chthoniobacteraceae bacterium]